MKKSLRKNDGFTLVEIIVVISIIAILSVMSVVAFNGVQANARRSALSSDASALAAAINHFNAQTRGDTRVQNNGNLLASPLSVTGTNVLTGTTITTSPGAPFSIRFAIPQDGVRPPEDIVVTFESADHRTRAINFIDYNLVGTGRHAVVATSDIQNWNTVSTTR
ncbi:MAG: prepilin-type N-terminal cleavage/methylation domain-containing protein [Defluviitaleaceae bacterium]|nr:prepilin-type N-terminal cleavage/methylation domain-containing protein [Defluviitaleaceae bacterium]